MKNNYNRVRRNTNLEIYNAVRQAYLKKSICNIGRIVEEESKIVCYVEQKLLDKYKGNNPIYKLSLNGMDEVTEGIKETVQNLKLNKPVYYVFKNIEFKTAVELNSLWSHIILKNCTFHKKIEILWANDIVFENNKYLASCSVHNYEDCFLVANDIKKITFINEQLSTIKIKAKKTLITNTDINAKEVYIDSENINFVNSTITSQNRVIIKNSNCDFVGNIQAPIIFYNGVKLTNEKEGIYKVDEKEKELKSTRIMLVETLHNLSNCCKEQNNSRIQSLKEQLNKQPISRILRR